MRVKHWAMALAILLIAAVASYILLKGDEELAPEAAVTEIAPPPPSPVISPAAVALPEHPAVLYPIDPSPSETPLPELGESDTLFRNALAEVLGSKGLSLLLSEQLIHHLVVTIDNLPRKHLAANAVPLKRAEGVFVTDKQEDAVTIGAQNAKRYAAYAALARTVNSEKLVGVYRRFYPLFQRAYQEIGYPEGHFNDRLILAIDDLLASPDPEPPIRLSHPKIFFEYADPDLESRSAGQKIMMRIGRDNAAEAKTRLREIRQLLAH